MNTVATITIDEAVTRFMLKNKKPLKDYVRYFEHACDLLQGLKITDSNQASLLVSSSINMPILMNDMLCAYLLLKEGEWVKQTGQETVNLEEQFDQEKRRVRSLLNNLSD